MFIRHIVGISAAGSTLKHAFDNHFVPWCGVRFFHPADQGPDQGQKDVVYVCPPEVQSHMWQLAQTKELQGQDPSIHLAHLLVLQLQEQSDMAAIAPSCQAGVILGSSRGTSDLLEDVIVHSYQLPQARALPARSSPYTTGSALAAYVCRQLRWQGGYMGVSAACASSLMAIGMAYAQLQCGVMEHMVVGGVEVPLSRSVRTMLRRTGIVSSEAEPLPGTGLSVPLRSFGQQRFGMVPAEGGGLLWLSAHDDGQAQAKICGFSMCSEEAGAVGVSADAQALQQAMIRACSQAQWSLDRIDLIAVHGAGTKRGDSAELNALQHLFRSWSCKPHLLITKWATGHTLGASGVLQLGLALEAAKAQTVPSPPYTLDHRAQGFGPHHARSISHLCIVSMGFGGIASALLVEFLR